MEALQALTLVGCVALLGCADREPPRWEQGAALDAEVDGEGVRLSWPEATDNEAVVAYRVLRGTDVITEVRAGDARRHRVVSIPPDVSVSFGIRAVDDAGLMSAPLRTEVEREKSVCCAPDTTVLTDDTPVVDADGREPVRTQGVPTLQTFPSGAPVHGRPPMTEAERARRGLPIRRRIGDRVVGGARLGQ